MTLLPPNRTPLERSMEAAIGGDEIAVPLRDLWSPQSCPEPLLPWLAWGLSVDDWDATWPLAVRRQVVARAIEIQRRKGTLAAVRSAVAAFGGAISIREWWQSDPPEEPGTFSLILALGSSVAAPTADYIAAVIRQVTGAKPLSRPFTFTVALGAEGKVGVASAVRPTSYVRLDMAA